MAQWLAIDNGGEHVNVVLFGGPKSHATALTSSYGAALENQRWTCRLRLPSSRGRCATCLHSSDVEQLGVAVMRHVLSVLEACTTQTSPARTPGPSMRSTKACGVMPIVAATDFPSTVAMLHAAHEGCSGFRVS